ncbi:MAG: epimerase [Patescibacteria group bacterium]|nr:MAG: epimerase [Patescibacteria group bacterium]
MKILITGAAGFLGLHLAKYADKLNWVNKVYLYDIAEFDKKDYPKNKSIFIKGDVRDRELLGYYISQSDFVIHSAAALPLWKKSDIFEVNITGTENVLALSLEHGIKRVVYISSTAVYGVPEKHPIEETDPLEGVGYYGISKIEAEKLCNTFIKKGLNCTIVRPKTFVGPYRLGVFEILFDWVYDGKKIPMIGDGSNRYQLLDVADLVECVYLFLKDWQRQDYNDVFNVGAKKFFTVSEDLKALFEFAGSGSSLLSFPAGFVKFFLALFYKLKLSPLYPWVYATADKDSFVSIEKIEKVLSWSPRYSNADALIRAYKWYLKHRDEIKAKGAGVTHRVGWKQGVLGVIKRFM